MYGVDEVTAIETVGLRKAFGKVQALDGLDLSVPRGDMCALLGPNGTGKPVTELRLSLPPERGRWTGRRLALASAAVCRSPETAWHACQQNLPSSVAAGALSNCCRRIRI
jgi:ABC-type transporter Mla maintaining outer membrane lipid asymmetry ATPase subunit MlaF